VAVELSRYEMEGIYLRCADGLIRQCYPVIGGFMLDHEEQALLTGVKYNVHCTLCQIPPDQRQYLVPLERWPLRTHEYTQDLITSQRRQAKATKIHGKRRWGQSGILPSDVEDASTDDEALSESDNLQDNDESSMAVDDVNSFMWDFHRVNMHEVMHFDFLHQGLKGLVDRTLNKWIRPTLKKRYGLTQAESRLDARFRLIPTFADNKTFQNLSEVTQWTGVEQKMLLRQMVPALCPLLSTEEHEHLRATVDFCLHGQYYSHDDETLSYVLDAIERMNVFKETYRDVTAPATGFNIPKLHAITHFPMMVRKFGSADGFDTAMWEACHKYLVKKWYNLTNKRQNYEFQILKLNIRYHNMRAMHDLYIFQHRDFLAKTVDVPSYATAVTNKPQLLSDVNWVPSSLSESTSLKRLMPRLPSTEECPYIKRSSMFWLYASTLSGFVQQEGFLDALAVFVRESRRRIRGEVSNNQEVNRAEEDCSWVATYPVCLHTSLTCWKMDRDDGSNADTRVKELIRCDPDWQQGGEWRRDHVWIQEWEAGIDVPTGPKHALQGRLPGRLLLLISVLDIQATQERRDNTVYTGAFVDVYTLLQSGRLNPKHGMIEARRLDHSLRQFRSTLGQRRFYRLELVVRSAHLVPVEDSMDGPTFYINPYIDWDQYATIYDPDFQAHNDRQRTLFARKHGWHKRLSKFTLPRA
jgi:hypothetical protein